MKFRGASQIGSRCSVRCEAIMMIQKRFLAPALVVLITASAPAQQHSARQSNMKLTGYNDLQARSSYQPVIQKQGDRWIAYIGHHAGVMRNPLTGRDEQNGTSVVDVTDPAKPRYLAHIPGEDSKGPGEGGGGGAQMVRTCAG